MSNPHQGDIGTVFLLTVTRDGATFDVSTATTKQLIFQDPGGVARTKAAAFTSTGTDGKIQYTTTAATDLNLVGNWKVQARVVLAAGDWKSEVVSFQVDPNIPIAS